MTTPLPVTALLVTDDPARPKQFERLLGPDSGIVLVFADTANAVARAFEDQVIDLAVVYADSSLPELFEAVHRQVRELDHPIGVIGAVEGEDETAMATLARAGVEGFVTSDNDRRIRSILLRQAELLRGRHSANLASHRLAEIEERYTLLLDSSSEAIAYLHEGLHIFANPAYLEMFGFLSFDEVEGLSMLDLLESSDHRTDLKQVLKALAHDEIPGEPILADAQRADGSQFSAVVMFSRARYGGEACAQMLVHEDRADADPALTEELRRIKQSDLLTGLLNHSALIDRLKELLVSHSDSTGIAVLMMSIDDHEKVQSRVGIGASDQLIRSLADMFVDAVGDEVPMARLRDHIFAVVLDDCVESQADAVSRKIVEHCQGQVVEIGDISLPVTVSVGVTQGSSANPSAETLISQADIALAETLRSGGNAYVRYRPRISSSSDDADLAWGERLVHALDHDEIQLLSSPVTSMDEDDFIIHEIESRLRSQDSDEVVMPSVFSAAASRLGLAPRMDKDLLRRLTRALQERAFSRDDLWMVTLSLQSATDAAFCDHLEAQMKQEILPARQMIWAFRDIEVQDKLRQTQEFIHRFGPMGCRFAVCDVVPDSATGPSLRFLELDFLRLAPEMVHNLSENEALRDQLAELVREASRNHVRIVAPKIDDTGDLATLWQLGITLVQGEFVRERAAL
jgi:diguanylate cyclase (GGDEF)-like protein/PAS domain S-box-containing protein